MKKVFAAILCCVFILCSREVLFAKVKQNELKQLTKEVSQNRAQIVSLMKDARNAFTDANQHIKILLKNKKKMKFNQMDILNEAIQSLKTDSEAFKSCVEDLNVKYAQLNSMDKLKNPDETRNLLNEIISLQSSRIRNLNQAISDMKRIAQI